MILKVYTLIDRNSIPNNNINRNHRRHMYVLCSRKISSPQKKLTRTTQAMEWLNQTSFMPRPCNKLYSKYDFTFKVEYRRGKKFISVISISTDETCNLTNSVKYTKSIITSKIGRKISYQEGIHLGGS